MENLNTLLEFLTESSNIQICITDISGILSIPSLSVLPKYRIHSKPFCDTAKMTLTGYNLCMRCKGACNKIAAQKKLPFGGLCAFGLYEVVFPVIIGSDAACIVYIGNIVTDCGESRKKLLRAAEVCGSDYPILSKLMEDAVDTPSCEKYFSMAQIIADYIRLLYKSAPETPSAYHWAVKTAMQYAESNYYHPLSLKAIADSCFINEKYLGRTFKIQTGKTFHEYLTEIRLNHAVSLLESTNQSVLQIALESGFNSPSYFNRAFFKKYDITPKKYKKNIEAK